MYRTYTNMETKQPVKAIPITTGKIADLGDGRFSYSEYPHTVVVDAKGKPQVGDFIVYSEKADKDVLVHYSEFLTKCLPTATRIG